MNPVEIHCYVQEADLAALNAAGEEGEPPLLLTVLDLSQWTRVFEYANTNLPTAMTRLQEMHRMLHQILTNDEAEIELANTTVMEVAIQHANN